MFEPDPSWFLQLPSEPAVDRLRAQEAEPWPGITPPEQIGLGWSLLVSDREEEVWARGREVPRFRWPAVGLLSPEVDRSLSPQDPPFGVVLSAEVGADNGQDRLPGLAFDDIELPVVVRYGHYEEHGPPLPHGRLACWGSTRNGQLRGWVTARHVAEHQMMAGVGTVLDSAPECLDAALVDVSPAGGGAPQPLAAPAIGSSVDLDLTIPRRATVLDVATNFGIQHSSRFPLRFSVDRAGQFGESGSHITAISSGAPLGIYLGAFTDRQTGASNGVGLAFTQLAVLIGLEVYA
jgi:hypothetical protein